jgi:hypothetical protein
MRTHTTVQSNTHTLFFRKLQRLVRQGCRTSRWNSIQKTQKTHTVFIIFRGPVWAYEHIFEKTFCFLVTFFCPSSLCVQYINKP